MSVHRLEREQLIDHPLPEVFEFFAAIGIPICEVWGMSELSSIATIVPPESLHFGTVGTPLAGIELRIADDGSVTARTVVLMPDGVR